MNTAYGMLAIAAILPVILSAGFYFLDKKTPFGRINKKLKQVIFGIAFGALAIVGTEWGIPVDGAQVNCRDAAVVVAGLLFGGPAGIIAGFIGGIERWIAVAWGVGSFTRLACSLSTVLAGFYAAALRKFLFEDKKPNWAIAFAAGVVIEIFHLTMVFITNMNTPIEAMAVVKTCTVPMVTANGISVMFSAVVVSLFAKERLFVRRDKVRISQTIQRWLLVTVLAAFLITSYFVFSLQDKIASVQTDSLLQLALDDIAEDINDASDRNLLNLAHLVADTLKGHGLKTLKGIAKEHDIAEISVVDKNGLITDSTESLFVGYDMASGQQSAEFLCLLDEKEEYVQKYGPIAYDKQTKRKYAGVRTENGFIQVGYDAVHFQQDIDAEVVGITRNRHVGKTGYILILDETYQVISAPTGFNIESLRDQIRAEDYTEANTTYEVFLKGEPAFCRYRTTEGYFIVSILPRAEALQMRNIALYVNAFMEILVFAILFLLIYLLIRRVVVNRIKEINRSLSKITNGNLDVVVDVRSNEEFASLSEDINSTVDTLKRYIAEASARIDKELEFAKNIQSSALPNTFPAFPKRKDFDIYATMDPAKEVGGDFYDFYLTGENALSFLIADVSGKGIPAAMFMMRAKTELKSLTEADLPLSDVFTNGNAALCEGNDAGMFVTAWQGNINLETGVVTYANAGHNPPLVRHADGKFEYLHSRAGFVLAGMEGMKYRTQELQLQPGDAIYLYTDGVTEATNANNELYGEERLQRAINSRAFESMQELCDYVKADVVEFVGDAPQFDDITMVALHYFGTPAVPSVHVDEAKLEDISEVTAFVEAELEKLDCPMKTVMQINVVIDEIFSNIVRYGYPKKAGPVTVELLHNADADTVSLRFTDEGIPYNPLKKEDPDVTLSAQERGIGGLGIFMVKKMMDEVKYAYENDKNILTVTKKL